MRCLLFLLLLLPLALHSQPSISHTPLRMIIPSGQLPEGVTTMHSNNNLDLAYYQGRYYVAFRTAPTHFASRRARIYLVSSTDMLQWQLEQDIWLGADLREPRFLEMDGQLHLYFFEGGTKMLKFEPRYVWHTMPDSSGKWSITGKLEGLDGFVPWRLRVHKGMAYLSAYYGKGLYQASHQGNLRLFTSTNGLEWAPLHTNAQVTTPGAEEGEFEFDREGNLWATVRLEGIGAYIAFAHKDSLHAWQLFPSKKKYDSACMFKHKAISTSSRAETSMATLPKRLSGCLISSRKNSTLSAIPLPPRLRLCLNSTPLPKTWTTSWISLVRETMPIQQ